MSKLRLYSGSSKGMNHGESTFALIIFAAALLNVLVILAMPVCPAIRASR